MVDALLFWQSMAYALAISVWLIIGLPLALKISSEGGSPYAGAVIGALWPLIMFGLLLFLLAALVAYYWCEVMIWIRGER